MSSGDSSHIIHSPESAHLELQDSYSELFTQLQHFANNETSDDTHPESYKASSPLAGYESDESDRTDFLVETPCPNRTVDTNSLDSGCSIGQLRDQPKSHDENVSRRLNFRRTTPSRLRSAPRKSEGRRALDELRKVEGSPHSWYVGI